MSGDERVITVWGRADSSAVARVMWTLAELGLAHQRIDLGGAHGGLDTPAYRAMNPAGRIPTVQLPDGRALWESNAIIRCLAALYSPDGLLPLDPIVRAEAEAWMDWSASFATAVSDIRSAYRAPGATVVGCAPAVAAAGPRLGVLERQLVGRAYVLGERLTVADLALGVWAHRLMRCPPELALPPLPALRAWYERLSARPAYAAHVVAAVSAGPQRLGGRAD